VSTGSNEIDPKSLRDDRCPFGRTGDTIDSATRQGKPYQVVRRLHAEFQESAANVLRNALSARKVEAEKVFTGEFTERSELVRALTKWKG
jgi:hypothetical protein